MLLKTVSSASHRGKRFYQEDRFFTSIYEQGTLLAVFDGHGSDQVSHLASEEFPKLFADEITETSRVSDVFRSCTDKLNALTENMESGSTLSLAFIPFKGIKITCAVLGDSPIIIKDANGKINISPDHNVRTNQFEADAAVSRGGTVLNGYLYGHGDTGYGDNSVGLQMARALGDSFLKGVLSHTPEIYEVEVNSNSFVLVASDGAFDPSHEGFHKAAQTAVEMIEDGATAEKLVKYAAIDYPTGDNVSCILARFEETPIVAEQPKTDKRKRTKIKKLE